MQARSFLLTAAIVALAAVLGSSRASAQDGGPPDGGGSSSAIPACMLVTQEARYVPYGYNHVVILKNGCSKAATCSVATDVNPQAVSVDVAANTTVEVLTYSASPSQTFTPRVSCKLR